MYYETVPSLPAPWWETRGKESTMWDAQCEADIRDEQEARDEANAAKRDIIEMIQEMDNKTFMSWYDQHCHEMAELAVRRFAAATMYHEEPAW